MICGSTKKKFDEKSITYLREMNNMNFTAQLGEFKLTFDEKAGEFKTNMNNKEVHDDNLIKKREEVKKLDEKSQEIDKTISDLEKEILMKVSRLYMMADMHAETKTQINLNIENYDPDGSKIQEMKQKQNSRIETKAK